MLAVRRQGRDLWHGRSGCDSFRLTEEKVECVWRRLFGPAPLLGPFCQMLFRPGLSPGFFVSPNQPHDLCRW